MLNILGLELFAIWLLGISLLLLTLISTPWLPEALLASLENRYSYLKHPEQQVDQSTNNVKDVHLLVLGAGDSSDSRLSYSGQLHLSSIYRLTECIRLYHSIPESRLVFTGNSGCKSIAQANVHALAAQELNINVADIYIIPEGWNTRTEAAAYYKYFGTNHKLYLITDAVHMPRAMMIFRDIGLDPIPAPTNYRLRQNDYKRHFSDYFPSAHYITYMELVFQAYLGVLWVKMGGD